MNILEWIKNLFASDKRNAQLYLKDLTKTFGESDKFEVGLYDGTTPLANRKVTINVNGKDYQKTTDNEGIARLNINLGVGEYTPLVSFSDDEYKLVTAFGKIIVKGNTRMEGTDIVKNASDKAVYQCAVYDMSNNRLGGDVDIIVNGVKYTKSIEADGLARLNINLGQGNYTLTANFNGNKLYNSSNVTNTITVKADPVVSTSNTTNTNTSTPVVTPQKSRSEKILDEFEKYFGKCEYIDDALAKIRNRKYAFYFSDGYNMYDTIKRMANKQGANCYDSAEVFYHLMLGMNTKYGRKYEPQYLHVYCPSSKVDHIRLRFKSNGKGWYYRDPASVLNGGSVESNWCGTSNNILEVNPSFIIDG